MRRQYPCKTLLTTLLLLLLYGCSQIPVVGTSPATTSSLPSQEARQALLDGHYQEAFTRFQALADTSLPPQRYDYLLSTLEAAIGGGFNPRAERLIAELNDAPLSSEQRFRYQILTGRLLMVQSVDLALGQLRTPAMPLERVKERKLVAEYRQLLSEAYHLAGNHIEGARELILREPELTSGDEILLNQLTIWKRLSALSGEAIEHLQLNIDHSNLKGWLALATVIRDNNLDNRAIAYRVNQWHLDYPEHPLLPELQQQWLEEREIYIQSPATVAVLLPLSGRYAKAAESIKDGILAAYYSDHQRPLLRLYDSADIETIATLYQRAISEGAHWVIGPLNKEAIWRLVQQNPQLSVPTLALNQIELPAGDNLYQFALSPESEGEELARHLWQEGHSRAVLLVPDGSLGNRMESAFSSYWQALGGAIVANASYNPTNSDFSGPIKSMLDLNSSKSRYRRLANTLSEELEYTPRRRHDIDCIVMLSHPIQGRLIRPQLKFHYASDIPVYATSHIYSGGKERDKDRDLDGIQFIDMPWILNPGSRNQYLSSSEVKLLDQHSGAHQRLVAFGLDAYRLLYRVKWLQQYSSEEYQGATGYLRIGSHNRLTRGLQLAQFRKGQARIKVNRPAEDYF